MGALCAQDGLRACLFVLFFSCAARFMLCGPAPCAGHSSRAHRRPALDSALVGLPLRSRPIPYRHRSNLASIEWFPATGRDWKSCCCSWSLEKGGHVQVQAHLTLRMVLRKKGGTEIVRVRRTSALVNWRGQRHGNHHTSRVFFPSFFFFGVFLFRVTLYTLWQP